MFLERWRKEGLRTDGSHHVTSRPGPQFRQLQSANVPRPRSDTQLLLSSSSEWAPLYSRRPLAYETGFYGAGNSALLSPSGFLHVFVQRASFRVDCLGFTRARGVVRTRNGSQPFKTIVRKSLEIIWATPWVRMLSKVGRLVIYILTLFCRAAFDLLPSYPIFIRGYDKQNLIFSENTNKIWF